MAKKEITVQFKLQAPGGTATPAPPIGPALGQHGVNPGQFIQKFNAMSAHLKGKVIGVLVTVYKDRTFDIELKSSAGQRPAEGCGQGREGQRRAEQEQDRQSHDGPVQGHRQGKEQGPQRVRRRSCRADHRGHGAVDGNNGRRMRLQAMKAQLDEGSKQSNSMRFRLACHQSCNIERPNHGPNSGSF